MEGILPIACRRIILRCLRDTSIGLFPEYRLAALLLSADAEHKDFADSLCIEVPRSGRVRYRSGEHFEFALYAAAPHAQRLSRVETLLRGLPESAPVTGEGVAFGDNWALQAIEDLLPDGGIHDRALDAEVAHWRGIERFRLRLTSPTRIVRPNAGASRGRMRYARSEGDIDDVALSHALTQSLVALKFNCAAADWRVPQIPLKIISKELFLVSPTHALATHRTKVLDEGLMGELVVEWAQPPDDDHWRHLLLLQFLGIGQGRAFGLGRIQLEALDGTRRKVLPRATHDLLQRAADDRNLALAYRHVANADDLREWPGPVVDSDDQEDHRRLPSDEQYRQQHRLLDTLATTLAAAAHMPAALRPVSVPKPDGGVRQLQIPSFSDRVAQRAVLQEIEPVLDPLFADCAYGFRRGRGREQARDRLLRHERDGERFVAETDIRAFFDTVAWWRIEARLRCLFGDDPVVGQILRWVEAPRADDEPRDEGLPQGAPLSPLLSNLMLDHFDRVLTGAGHSLVRFADDLVIVGKQRDAVEAGLALAAQVLAEGGLTLKLDKTRVCTFADGFRFLGYQFIGGLAVPSKAGSFAVVLDERDGAGHDAQEGAHLEEALVERITPLPETSSVLRTLATNGEEPGTLLVINAPRSKLSLHDGQLLLTRADGQTSAHPFGTLSAVLMAARAQLSTEVIKAAMRAQVPIHFLSDSGAWVGSTAAEPDAETLTLWQQQRQRFGEPAAALAASREVVAARIASMVTLLNHRRATPAIIQRLRDLLDASAQAHTLDVLRGIEGQATRQHFQAIAHLLPFDFPFEQRNRRPPRDPVNALLSFGYTLLYQAAHAVLTAERLNPRIGFYHQPRGTHAALASDCIEPFRFIVERQVLSMLNRRELRTEDFIQQANGACYLCPEPRRTFVLRMHERFQQPLRAEGATQALGLYGHLQWQAIALRSMITTASPWAPPRFR